MNSQGDTSAGARTSFRDVRAASAWCLAVLLTPAIFVGSAFAQTPAAGTTAGSAATGNSTTSSPPAGTSTETRVTANRVTADGTAIGNPSPAGVAPEAGPVAARIAWTFEASQATVPSQGDALYLRIRIDTGKSTAAQARKPLNVALVLDRSNSMNIDSKLGFLIKAAHLVTDNLTPQDHAALVTYHHEVQTMVPMHPVVNREYLHDRIDEIEADGYTNISGGLLEGMAQMKERAGAPGLHHMILFTDGVANEGVTDSDKLVGIVRMAHDRNMTISTIGVGVEYDESLMKRMAQAGGGRYSYVAQPDQIPDVIRSELGSLLAVAAQNAKLTIEVPPGLKVDHIFGREERLGPGKVEIPLGDLTIGVNRTLTIRMRPTATYGFSGGKFPIVGTLTFDDATTFERRKSQQTIDLIDRRTTQADLNEVASFGQLVEEVDKIIVAVKSMDSTLAHEVLRFRQNQFPRLKQAALAGGDQEFVNKAFLYEYFSGELAELVEAGALHEHNEDRQHLQKDLHYRHYLMEHQAHAHAKHK
ncbi:MAG: VWA domain-containing protein [Planctomycetia bacterium]|nr:VWA domain-containing protein [Planctomycetia bacterium]